MTRITKDTTIGEAAMVHGIDPDMLIEEIQNYLQSVG